MIFMVTDPDSGRKLRLTGDSPPTEAELDQIFSTLPPLRETTLGEQVKGTLETAGVIGSSILAEPAAGIAGIATGVLTQDPAAASAVVKGVRERLTIEPETEVAQQQLQSIGETIAPAVEVFGAAEEALGTTALETAQGLGASPEVAAGIAAVAKTIPTALLELTGAVAAKGISKIKTGRELSKAIKESTPTIDQLKDGSRKVFNEISDLGATVEPKALAALTGSIEKAARNSGARPRTTPQVFGVIDEFKEVVESGRIIDLDELDELRTVAQNAAKSIDPAQKGPAIAIIDEIDDFLDRSGTGILNLPEGAPNIGLEYRAARKLWGKARKAETLELAITNAKDTASGLENGLRIEFRKILKNKRQNKFFNADEKAAMRQVSEGTKASNLAKLIGRLGFSEGQAINIINPAIGGGLAAAAFGAPAGIAVPVIGQVSKQLAQRLTRGNARFAQQVVKAGSDAELITKAYMRNTSKGKRSAIELSELFVKNEIDLSTVKSAIAKEAADIAKQSRLALRGGVIGGTIRPEQENGNN